MTQRKRSPRRGDIAFEHVLALSNVAALMDSNMTAQGYRRARGRAFRRMDGTYTARLVWRHDKACVSSCTLTIEGLVLA